MKLDEGDRIIGVAVCNENNDVLLTTADGQAIRFPVTDVRVFKGREFAGVRGIKLEGATRSSPWPSSPMSKRLPAERMAYVRQANMRAPRRRRVRVGHGEPRRTARRRC